MTLFLLADLVSSYLNYVCALLLLWNRRGAQRAWPFWFRALVALALSTTVNLLVWRFMPVSCG